MTQTQLPQNTIDHHKIEKYFPRLLNGEAEKLEAWLPNLITKGNMLEREKSDYRNSLYRRKEPQRQSTDVFELTQLLKQARVTKERFIMKLAEYKQNAEACYEKHRVREY